MRISEHITALKRPYKGIETTVLLVRTPLGAVLFDAASYEEDIREGVLPWLTEQGIAVGEVKYVFISHDHADHAGGLPTLLECLPHLRVVTQSAALRDKYGAGCVHIAGAGEMLLDCLQVVSIPGHTADSAALLDTRDGTLICGDCLQLHGIFGQGKWGANVPYPTEHRLAIARLREMPIETVVTAHDYYPMGEIYRGREEIAAALDACLAPLDRIEGLIAAFPELGDEAICAIYNEAPMTPTLGSHVVKAVRRGVR